MHMTNPSAGLPEELEKIVQEMSPDEGSGYLEELRVAMREVLDWACKKLCPECAKGKRVTRGHGPYFVHPGGISGGGEGSRCAASVLREGLK